MIFPALVSASTDDQLRGAPLDVYLWLCCHRLDFIEYRPVKIGGLATSRRLKSDTASRALRILVERGYIERRYLQREGYTYRLRLTRADSAAA